MKNYIQYEKFFTRDFLALFFLSLLGKLKEIKINLNFKKICRRANSKSDNNFLYSFYKYRIMRVNFFFRKKKRELHLRFPQMILASFNTHRSNNLDLDDAR